MSPGRVTHWALWCSPPIVAVLPTTRTPAQEARPTRPGRWSCSCAGGCPIAPWCWWATTATPPRPPLPLPIPASAGYSDCQTAPGRRPLCASARPSAWAEWPTAAERPAATFAEIPPCAGSSGLDHRRGVPVRRRHPHRGAHLPTAVWYRSAPVTIPTQISGVVVCPALAIGGHPVSSTGQALPGSPDPSGYGNPTSVIRPGHRPHHARTAGPLLLDHPGRPHPATRASHHPAHCGLVRQTVADLRGCHRPGASASVVGVGGFRTVSRRP